MADLAPQPLPVRPVALQVKESSFSNKGGRFFRCDERTVPLLFPYQSDAISVVQVAIAVRMESL